MRVVHGLIACLVLASSAPAGKAEEASGVMARIHEGWIQCYNANSRTRTCQSIGRYQITATEVLNTSELLVSPDGPVTVRTTMPLTIRDETECGTLRAAMFDKSQFRVGARNATSEEVRIFSRAVRPVFAALFDKEICETHVADGSGFRSRTTIDGVQQPDNGEIMTWVRPTDGYKVGPPA